MAYHPLVQHHVAEMRITLEASGALLDRTLDEWSAGVDHGNDRPVKIVAAKHVSVTGAWRVVDTALERTGGGGIFKRDRMEQLFRDARLGLIHPANTLLADELIGTLSLGIHPDEQPRWG
jgi:alkylation response protein AidB-like acyl-CoA dehydrogenase